MTEMEVEEILESMRKHWHLPFFSKFWATGHQIKMKKIIDL